MDEPWSWHRLFGLMWMDFFYRAPVTVEMEKDLSLKQQFLDIVLLRMAEGPLPRRLPDGFEDLGRHNLISFKSCQDTLDGWTLDELVGHYVNYRKQVSPTMQELLPESDFRLFAVSARYPQGLARQVGLEQVQEGIYQVRHFTGVIRIAVVSQLPQQEHNGMLCLFAASDEQRRYGAMHHSLRSPHMSTLLYQLYRKYRQEGLLMPPTLEEMVRATRRDILREMPLEDRREFLKDMTPQERLEMVKDMTPQERLEMVKEMTPQERLEMVKETPPEERLEGLTLEQRLAGLSTEEILAALEQRQKAAGSAPKQE